MEAERQEFQTQAIVDREGKIIGESASIPVGPIEKFEYGVPPDTLSAVIGGGYTSNWSPDFLQKKLGNVNGKCSRFYFDRKIAVDVGDPAHSLTRLKRKLLFRGGFGYLCLPTNFPDDKDKLHKLYDAAIKEYYAYEALHQRPAVLQEAIIIDSKGVPRRTMVTAIDVKVGVGVVGSVEQQAAEIQKAMKAKPSRNEILILKKRARLHRALRRCAESSQPFRNPFIGHGKRLYAVEYAK